MRLRATAITFLVALTIGCSSPNAGWVSTWTASPAQPFAGYPVFQGHTLREIVRVSVGGTAVRITLSNLFGTAPLSIATAHIAFRSSGSGIVPTSDQLVTFGHSSAVTIPAGESVVSDTLQMQVPQLTDLAVSLYLPAVISNPTVHPISLETTYVSQGDHTADMELAANFTITSWPFLTNVEVTGETNRAVVAFGDSVTDGFNSTLDANHRWTDTLANRLLSQSGGSITVLNAGLSGNRVLHDAPQGSLWYGPSALSRFNRDVLGQAGLKYVIVLEGMNDIALPGFVAPESEGVTSAQITEGLLQLIQRAHSNGVRIYGGTLTPFEGATYPGYYTGAKEAQRQQVNQWIRSSKSFDAVIDFDQVLRDPNQPTKLLPQYDSGDHVHPNDAGYHAMAGAVDLHMFE
jgi:lysophospholipase L1-like esterase